ncbi:hypothetical protein GRQ63_03075 [Streptomyces sp. YIM 132580]|nr:hypothetical protein [Streptomyces sp. YIM 132580]MYR95805.1 hypothetical protein [Streptomyces sp. SID4937]NYS18860.1 hypothetical protein [Streptomyces sp. SJ1-7]
MPRSTGATPGEHVPRVISPSPPAAKRRLAGCCG